MAVKRRLALAFSALHLCFARSVHNTGRPGLQHGQESGQEHRATTGLSPCARTRFGLKKKIIAEVAMKHLDNLALPMGLLTQDSLSGITELVKELFTRTRVEGAEKDKLSYWQFIFLQSKANGCIYSGESLPHARWQWPRDTWFQEQMEYRLKALEFAAHQTRN